MLEGKRSVRRGPHPHLAYSLLGRDKESTVAKEAGSPVGEPPIIARAPEGD